MPIQYDKELNPSQHEAVMCTEGPLLVIAGAGSGKTRTLTFRTARLVEQGVAPDQVLLLTFTRKAAEQMIRRAAALLDGRCARVSGGTFHSFSLLLLRRHAERLGYSNRFVILDRADSEVIIEGLRKEAVPRGTRGFPRKRTLAEIFGKSVNKAMEVKEVIEEEFPHFLEFAGDIEHIYQRYVTAKADGDLMDFDDLLVNARLLLATEPEVRRAASAAYRYIMVDEYQDTNLLQAEILRLLADGHDNVMAVGDDSQSIYAFRGACFENILRFPEVYEGAKIVRLRAPGAEEV
ncbi:MAG: UvrD-helicase domain-containing protein [Deltaproteobacteria bacterium]|nr:UvrD-helicase domain-containing protein [Deltaproteobacteria bacterium]